MTQLSFIGHYCTSLRLRRRSSLWSRRAVAGSRLALCGESWQQGGCMEAKSGYRKCICCKQAFIPDRRSRGRQRFCSKRECRKASKRESQRRWASKPANRDYWRGPEQVARVQAWRKQQPEYWRRAAKKIALQEKIARAPLQDHIIGKDPLIIGLVSMIAGSTLQDKIAATCRDLIAKGHEILQGRTAAAHYPRPSSHRIRPNL
jgi:hypothetical protein